MSQYLKFSHKKKYCGIKDIRVLFYSSIFQMIIVFPFIVLKYFRFAVTPLTQFYVVTLWFIVVLSYLLKVTAN